MNWPGSRTGWLLGGSLLVLGGLGWHQSVHPPATVSQLGASAQRQLLNTNTTKSAADTANEAVVSVAVDSPFATKHSWEGYRVVVAPRRYVGTIGGEPATAELKWERDSITGRFYLWQRAAEYSLASTSHRKAETLALHLTPSFASQNLGHWQLTKPMGQVLQGYWIDSTGQRRTIALRENYRSGVRYEIQQLTYTGAPTSEGRVPEYSYDFVHLLGPAANRWPLSRAQWPPRAKQRQLLMDGEGAANRSHRIEVRLNDFQLLSYQTAGLVDPFEGQNDSELLNTLVDLTTGRQLTITSQLRPSYERKLRQLLSHHLLHDPEFDDVNNDPDNRWEWRNDQNKSTKLVSLPNSYEGFALTTQGLEAKYSNPSLHGGGGDNLPVYAVFIPYRELRPLVRPGTPLARMLRARGMW